MTVYEHSTTGMTRECRSLAHSVRYLWENRHDTADMARILNVREDECERALHFVLAMRRSITGYTKNICGNE